MRIEVITTGLLRQYLPASAAGGSRANLELADGTTISAVMTQLGMPAEGQYLVTVNGTLIHAEQRVDHVLKDADQLALMTPLRGG